VVGFAFYASSLPTWSLFSCLLPLRPCVRASLLLCCWVCHLCRVPTCFLLALEVEICLLLLAVCWIVVLVLLVGCAGSAGFTA